MKEIKPLLQVKNLKVVFDKHIVLDGINFQVNKNELISIVGKSGSGKTVILRALAGLIQTESGTIDLSTDNRIPVGFAFQKSPLFPWLTVIENLNICVKTADERENCERLLKEFGLEKFRNHYPRDISGGMSQKVNLLRALSNQCELILMDEPFASLDGFQRAELQQFTQTHCRGNNRSLILITHDIDEALLLSDRILILSSRSGQIHTEIAVDLKKHENLLAMRSDPQYMKLYDLVHEKLAKAEAFS